MAAVSCGPARAGRAASGLPGERYNQERAWEELYGRGRLVPSGWICRTEPGRGFRPAYDVVAGGLPWRGRKG